jgi:regulator-associated protein of mTOR
MAGVVEQPCPPLESPEDQDITSSRPSSSAAGQALLNRPVPDTNGHAPRTLRPSLNGGPAGRPSLLRARSDFGPRHQHEHPQESADEASSADGNFKIRHGWDDQLNSEEYNNLLTSVSSSPKPASTTFANAVTDVLHVLHGQEA